MHFFLLMTGLLTACGPKKIDLKSSIETKFKRIKIIKAPAPPFPEEGLAMAKSGKGNKCLVQVFMDTKGKTEHVKISECHEVFHENTQKTVKKWKFEPYVDVKGKTHRVNFKVQITFKKTK